MLKSWKCPYCNQFSVIKDQYDERKLAAYGKIEPDGEVISSYIVIKVITCLNEACKGVTIENTIYDKDPTHPSGEAELSKKIIRVLPANHGKDYSDYVPQAILKDYQEAYAIVDLSPKASATLARRCLQGMIRDFWGVKKNNLFEEINEIEDKVSSELKEAMHNLKNISNIGAHPEKDINLIIDIEPNEARLLIEFIEMFIVDWYIVRHQRQKKIDELNKVAQLKKEMKANNKP